MPPSLQSSIKTRILGGTAAIISRRNSHTDRMAHAGTRTGVHSPWNETAWTVEA
jgi:hypothetical protein